MVDGAPGRGLRDVALADDDDLQERCRVNGALGLGRGADEGLKESQVPSGPTGIMALMVGQVAGVYVDAR